MIRACKEQCGHCTDRELLNMKTVNKHARFPTDAGNKCLFVLCFALVQKTCLQAASTFCWFHKVRGVRLAAWGYHTPRARGATSPPPSTRGGGGAGSGPGGSGAKGARGRPSCSGRCGVGGVVACGPPLSESPVSGREGGRHRRRTAPPVGGALVAPVYRAPTARRFSRRLWQVPMAGSCLIKCGTLDVAPSSWQSASSKKYLEDFFCRQPLRD